uniref:Uncharacterized protein n=1 Tax=Ditylenchus dipsaci TaxID=166011 RepID=A0A915CM35_9BILA
METQMQTALPEFHACKHSSCRSAAQPESTAPPQLWVVTEQSTLQRIQCFGGGISGQHHPTSECPTSHHPEHSNHSILVKYKKDAGEQGGASSSIQHAPPIALFPSGAPSLNNSFNIPPPNLNMPPPSLFKVV